MTAPTPTARVRKLGDGDLTIGDPGSPVDFAGAATKASITWKVDTTDDTEVLSGDVLAGDRTYTATLEATVYQDDLTVGGLIDYSWTNKGAEVPFAFTPYAGSRSVTGTLVVDPLDVGGEVGKKNTADLKWACLGEPELTNDLP